MKPYRSIGNVRRGCVRAALWILVMCFVGSPRPGLAIIGGEVDGAGHPAVGAVDTQALGLPLVGSGVLISPTVFLTAGHVTHFFDDAGVTQARVTFDPVVTASSTWYTGTVHTNPAFQTLRADEPGDIGVIVFDDPIPGIAPALLPEENLLATMRPDARSGLTLTVVGYGVTQMDGGSNGGGPPDPDLASGGTRKRANESLLSLTEEWLRVGVLDDSAICLGDSGGPAFLNDSDVIGSITSYIPAGCKNVAWNIRLDTPEARAFLTTYVVLP
jgi:hypothetical protein